jgi:hypothetical protein
MPQKYDGEHLRHLWVQPDGVITADMKSPSLHGVVLILGIR